MVRKWTQENYSEFLLEWSVFSKLEMVIAKSDDQLAWPLHAEWNVAAKHETGK